MQKTYMVIQEYENSNADPIILKVGDGVNLGEIFKDDVRWPNWVYCVSIRTGKAGWTPIQILKIDGKTGIAVTEYTAKELTVSAGDIVSGDNELNGWLWCLRKADGQQGWVPKNCLHQVK